jgi:hypothetical protein
MAENDEGSRTQPEYSQGERLATLEARLVGSEAVQQEKLLGLRAEHQAALAAQRDAVLKVESVTDRRFENAATQAEKREELLRSQIEGLDTRLQTVERGESAGVATKTGFNAAWATVVIAITILISLGSLIAIIITNRGS